MASKDTSEILTNGVNEERQQPLSHTSRRFPGWLASWIIGIRSRFNPPAPWVVLLGLDGSGKSSVLSALEEIFSPPSFTGVQVISRHPGFLYDHRLQVKPSTNHTDEPIAIEHYGKPPHGAIKSMFKLGILALDWLAGYWGRIVHDQAKGHLILFDRHFFVDVSIDPLRYRYGGPAWFAHFLGRLLPGPDLMILLDAPIEVLQARKQEIAPQEATLQRAAYLELIQKWPNSHIIDVSKPLEQVIEEVKQIIANYKKI